MSQPKPASDAPSGLPKIEPRPAMPAPRASRVTFGQRVHAFFTGRGVLVVVIGLLVALLVALQISKVLAVSRRDRALDEAEARLTARQTELIQKSRVALGEEAGELLKLSAAPLAWAIRTELIAGDLRDVDAYMAKLVKEPHIKRIALIDRSGLVVSSTNLKLKGEKREVAFPGVALDGTEPRVFADDGEQIRLVVPIMSFDEQIGTLVLDYASAAITEKLPH